MTSRIRKGLMMATIILAAFSAPALAATPTPTLDAQMATEKPPTRANAIYIDPRRIAADPEKYAADFDDFDAPYYNVYVRGTVGNVRQFEDFTWLHFAAKVQDTSLTEQFVIITPRNEDILRGMQVCVYGIPFGTESAVYEETGAETEIAAIFAYEFKAMVGPNTGICPKT